VASIFPHSIHTPYPGPDGFADASIAPQAAYFDAALGEFILPYDAVRKADDPDATLMQFLQTTYDSAARLGQRGRAQLECETGVPRRPRTLDA
jgi:hypothetical protein